jgi:NitT/TauT family transport system substrate-binding protein
MKKVRKVIRLVYFITILALAFNACKSKTEDNRASVVVDENKTDATDSKEVVANTEKVVPIKIMYSASLCGIPLHIAKQLQFYEAEGLVEGVDYEYVTSSTPGVEMLTTGQADVVFGLVAAMLAPLDNGLEAKTVLGIHTGCIQILAGKDTGITDVAGLKGKKIGISQLASSAHIVTQRALADAGIGSITENMEVEFIVYAADDLPLALKNGAVDAIAIGDPKATILINEGEALAIFNSATDDLLKDEYCCSLWVSNDTIDNNSKQLAKVVTAIQKASIWVDNNVDLAAQIQLDNEWLVGDLAIDQEILKTYKYIPSVSGVEEALTRNILDMKELGLIKEGTDAEELAKTGFYLVDGVSDEVTGTVEAPIDPTSQLKTE